MTENRNHYRSSRVDEAHITAAEKLYKDRLSKINREILDILCEPKHAFEEVATDKKALMGRNIAVTIQHELGDAFSRMEYESNVQRSEIQLEMNEETIQLAQSVQSVLQSIIDVIPAHSGHEPSRVQMRDPELCIIEYHQFKAQWRRISIYYSSYLAEYRIKMLKEIICVLYRIWKELIERRAI